MLFGSVGIGDKSDLTLGRFDGVILIGFFAGYLFYMVKIALKASREGKSVEIEGGSDEDIKIVSVPVSIIFIVGGAIAIAFGGDVTVDAASRIASDLGNEPNAYRTYDRFDRNTASGAGNFCCCSQKE